MQTYAHFQREIRLLDPKQKGGLGIDLFSYNHNTTRFSVVAGKLVLVLDARIRVAGVVRAFEGHVSVQTDVIKAKDEGEDSILESLVITYLTGGLNVESRFVQQHQDVWTTDNKLLLHRYSCSALSMLLTEFKLLEATTPGVTKK